jgi:tetratricopeptide (TPR) repeat protein
LLIVIGTTRLRKGETDADIYYNQAYEIAQPRQDQRALSMLFEHRGHQARFQQDYPAAHQWFTQSLATAEQLQDKLRIYFAVLNLGDAELYLGHHQRAHAEPYLEHYERARALHQRAFELAQTLQYGIRMARSLESIGMDWHALEDREKAQDCFDHALALYDQNNAKSAFKELVHFMQENEYTVKPEYLGRREPDENIS